MPLKTGEPIHFVDETGDDTRIGLIANEITDPNDDLQSLDLLVVTAPNEYSVIPGIVSSRADGASPPYWWMLNY